MEVGQEVEDVLQLVEDGVVHWKLPRHHLLQVVPDVFQVFLQALQGLQLTADSLTEGAHCFILDIPTIRTGGGGGGKCSTCTL